MNISELTIDRFSEVLGLFRRTPGICVRDVDSLEATKRYLDRNPGLSFIAESDRVIGCAMSGHDGRRGYLQHVVVDEEHRGQGVAHELVSRCLSGLERCGIFKIHIDVLITNDLANGYWQRRGWMKRLDIHRYSMNLSSNPNA